MKLGLGGRSATAIKNMCMMNNLTISKSSGRTRFAPDTKTGWSIFGHRMIPSLDMQLLIPQVYYDFDANTDNEEFFVGFAYMSDEAISLAGFNIALDATVEKTGVGIDSIGVGGSNSLSANKTANCASGFQAYLEADFIKPLENLHETRNWEIRMAFKMDGVLINEVYGSLGNNRVIEAIYPIVAIEYSSKIANYIEFADMLVGSGQEVWRLG